MPYILTLDLLTRALNTLDEMDEAIAAAHLSGVIDMVRERLGEQSLLTH